MTRRRSGKREEQGSRRYSSSSGSSFSSESDVESGVDSDVSSDGLDMGLTGTSEAQQKFKRLRRIFLNRPTKQRQKENKQRRRSPIHRVGSQLEQRHHSHRRRDSISSNSASDERVPGNVGTAPTVGSVRPLQAVIDQHLHVLWEQMKRHSAKRDSNVNQVQSMLEQAVDELQFLKKQEERALESQVRLIRESYALHLEVFQQQYLSKVAEIEDEMYASIQKRQEECDASILAAAKKLQDQTQHALLKDLATMNSEAVEDQLESSSFSTASSSASQSKVQRHRRVLPLPHDPLSSPQPASRVVKQASPVSRQRAKLQALEDKLAAFSPESLNRVKIELATPIRRSRAARAHVKLKRTPVPTNNCSLSNADSSNTAGASDREEWRASPRSPLRQGPSYWKNGISLEARDGKVGCDTADGARKRDHVDAASTSSNARRQALLLNRRFLRPEEDEELRHLRASIGLAKDWMTRNSQE